MTKRIFGTIGRVSAATVSRASLAFMLVTGAPGAALAQDTPPPTPAPSPGRVIDFRLPPPEDDGRASGIQGPSNNGLPPRAPGERRGPSPAPTPAPTPTPAPGPPPAPPRVTPTQPDVAASPRRAVPTTRDVPSVGAENRPVASPDAVAAPELSVPPFVDTEIAARPAEDAALAPAVPAGGDAMPLWAWLLAALAAVGAGFWYWRRRPAHAGESSGEVAPPPPLPNPRAADVPRRPAAARPDPVSRPVPATPRPATPLVTRPAAERRAEVAMVLDVKAIRFTPTHVAVAFALNIANRGAVAATGMMVRIALQQGSAMPEAVLARFFDGAGGSVLRDDMVLAAGAGEAVTSEVLLAREAFAPLVIGGKPMLVPVLALDVTYHWDGEGEAFGQIAGSFVLGREAADAADGKLAPLRLDRASYAVDRAGARATAMRRSQ